MTTYLETEDAAAVDDGPRLHALLVYEDFHTGLRIKQAFDHVVSHLEPKEEFHVNAWRFSLLCEPVLRSRAASEAAESDIVLLSAHGKSQLPAEIKSCLCQWLDQKDDRPHALVVSLDADAKQSGEADETLAYLRSMAEQAGLDMFTHFGNAAHSEFDLTIESIRQRADITPGLLESILHRSVPPPRWGINE